MPRYRLHDTLTFALADGGELVVEHGSTVFFDGAAMAGMKALQELVRAIVQSCGAQGAAETVEPRRGAAHVRSAEDRSGIRALQAADNPAPEMTTERLGLGASMQTQQICLG
jgi:hypothetical protein